MSVKRQDSKKRKPASTKNADEKNETKNGSSRKPAEKAIIPKKEASPKEKKQKKERDPQSTLNQILPFVFFVCAVLSLLVLILNSDGFAVRFTKSVFLGLFSAAAFLIPAIFVLLGTFWRTDIISNKLTLKIWCSGISLTLVSMLMHMLLSGEKIFNPIDLYKLGNTYHSGGVIGGFLATVLISAVGKTIAYIIILSALFISVLLLFGLTPRSVYIFIAYRIKVRRDKKREEKEAQEALVEPTPQVSAPKPSTVAAPEKPAPKSSLFKRSRKKKFDPDVDISDDNNTEPEKGDETESDQDVIDKKIFDEVMKRTRERYGDQNFAYGTSEIEEEKAELSYGTATATTITESKKSDVPPAKTVIPPVSSVSDGGEIDLSKIFVDPEKIEHLAAAQAEIAANDELTVIEAERDIVSDPTEDQPLPEAEDPVVEEPIPVYEFPPTAILSPPEKRSAADIAELKENSQKLVDTLRSFNVKARVADVSFGPTITRYELSPEAGTRVRSISNLTEDIALGLAVPNVRIEAPIPGKAAVGIEVPNKKRENVYLRALIENDLFTSSKSKLTAALGSDVAGTPVYCDIAKMPHLLVSGATGMGKSVCINSIIVSLLYKATPQEIRLLMIDPKKVELNIYNGIPHLHVPVVSDAKKAAGTLAWAVTEMERRYELIENVGVRNIQNYNEITANDPEKEFMPQMVIIIDELADLMMTAPDDVETSICRIAQMGRAAGIHLIIGTQRPSVDVITGLIKANIPSRIAFKMASQVDSRTVIDIAGAEKLLGRGDMLYAPVGVMKPQRVQGAFVSEAEVQKVVDFIKGIFPMPQYDEAAINGIEEAAAKCGQKKGRGASGDASDGPVATDDPMLKQALELAVETGKISTSLIQRRLSLGYGRAAKLIDTMEARGYVSAPDGQRPRDVLITRQQYQELVLQNEFD